MRSNSSIATATTYSYSIGIQFHALSWLKMEKERVFTDLSFLHDNERYNVIVHSSYIPFTNNALHSDFPVSKNNCILEVTQKCFLGSFAILPCIYTAWRPFHGKGISQSSLHLFTHWTVIEFYTVADDLIDARIYVSRFRHWWYENSRWSPSFECRIFGPLEWWYLSVKRVLTACRDIAIFSETINGC